ncbi:MAG: pseudaminic acid synthase [Lachnospiraceae bacterium]|nr:pseudaminic acid synthase [Lachnospiraceae bacterium]
MNKEIRIGDRLISEDSPSYIIAEMSGNHNGDINRAFALIEAAAEAGADAVKIQTYTADTITLNCDKEDFQIKYGTIWDGVTLYQLYSEAGTPYEWQPALMAKAKETGITLFSSPFDETAVDLLESMEVPAYKIASFEITDIPLIRRVASTHKPVIISTGIAYPEDIELALSTCAEAGNEDVILLKCCSAYPSPYEDINLRVMSDMKDRFDIMTGLSDHTLGHLVSGAAVAMGARVIEKHLTLRRADGGPDAEFSMEPEEFAAMVRDIRTIEKAMGKVTYELTDKQKKNRAFSRSLYIAEDMKAGDILTPENLRSVRPGYGMHTKYYEEMLGKRVKKDVSLGTRMSEDLI